MARTDKEMHDKLARVRTQNEGNDVALGKALDRAFDGGKKKIEQEFAKLQGQTVRWRFTVWKVSQFRQEVSVDLNEHATSSALWERTEFFTFASMKTVRVISGRAKKCRYHSPKNYALAVP